MKQIKNINKIKNTTDKITLTKEYNKKIKLLSDQIDDIIEIIKNLNGYPKETIFQIDNDIKNYAINLEHYEEMAYSSSEDKLITAIRKVNAKYRQLQIDYITKKFVLMNEELDRTINDIQKSYDETVEEVKDTTNSLTSNMLFSIAAIFLGMSVTSAMVTGIVGVEPKYYILYFTSMIVTSIIVIGFSSILIKNNLDSSKEILKVIGLAIIFWVAICLMTYFV